LGNRFAGEMGLWPALTNKLPGQRKKGGYRIYAARKKKPPFSGRDSRKSLQKKKGGKFGESEKGASPQTTKERTFKGKG